MNQIQAPQAPQPPQSPRIARISQEAAAGGTLQRINTAEEVQAAQIRLENLRRELQDAAERRNSITQRLRSADVEARNGYLERLQVVDERIIGIEREITQVVAQLGTAPAEAMVAAARAQAPDPDIAAFRDVMDEIVPIIAILSIFVFMPIAVAVSRFIWKRATGAARPNPALEHATQQKLDHLQQAVDTIAIEVERISEGQRFVTKLMSDRALSGGSAEAVRVGNSALPSERG